MFSNTKIYWFLLLIIVDSFLYSLYLTKKKQEKKQHNNNNNKKKMYKIQAKLCIEWVLDEQTVNYNRMSFAWNFLGRDERGFFFVIELELKI